MKNKTLLFFIALLPICLLAACNKKPAIEWKTFKGDNFMIDYPANWDLDSTGHYNVQVFACLSPETSNAKETLSIGIVKIIDSADLKTAVNNFMKQWNAANVSKSKSIEIGTQSGLYIEANLNNTFFKNYFVKKDDILFYLFCAGHTIAHKQWEDNALKTINSFRVINE